MIYDNIFLEGETCDLIVPDDNEETIKLWSKWFNQSKTTKFLSQGAFPNTVADQLNYFKNLSKSTAKLLCLIKPKSSNKPIGVASLSEINLLQKQATMALVIGEEYTGPDSIFIALETKAILTQHAFDVVGIERLNSLQVVDLKNWQDTQILFGFQIEGILRNKFRKGYKAYDMLVSSCILEDYLKIIALRNGVLWPGKKEMFNLMRSLPDTTLIDQLIDWLDLNQKEYWKKVYGE